MQLTKQLTRKSKGKRKNALRNSRSDKQGAFITRTDGRPFNKTENAINLKPEQLYFPVIKATKVWDRFALPVDTQLTSEVTVDLCRKLYSGLLKHPNFKDLTWTGREVPNEILHTLVSHVKERFNLKIHVVVTSEEDSIVEPTIRCYHEMKYPSGYFYFISIGILPELQKRYPKLYEIMLQAFRMLTAKGYYDYVNDRDAFDLEFVRDNIETRQSEGDQREENSDGSYKNDLDYLDFLESDHVTKWAAKAKVKPESKKEVLKLINCYRPADKKIKKFLIEFKDFLDAPDVDFVLFDNPELNEGSDYQEYLHEMFGFHWNTEDFASEYFCEALNSNLQEGGGLRGPIISKNVFTNDTWYLNPDKGELDKLCLFIFSINELINHLGIKPPCKQ